MKEGWKIAGCVTLIGLLGTDIGLQVVGRFAPALTQTVITTQQDINTEGSQKATADPKSDDSKGYALIITALGAGSSILTLLVIGYQTLIFRGQHRIMEGQRRLMRRQANISSRQTDIMQRQADLETPQLFCEIRDDNFVAATGSLVAHPDTNELSMREPPKVTFGLCNFGRSPAILRSIKAAVERKQTAPNEQSASYSLTDLPPEHVIGGNEASSNVTVGMSIFAPLRQSELNMLIRGQTYWWFFGFVSFDDVWAGERVLHFCWRYDQSIRVFDPYPPERNYTEHLQKSAGPHGTPPEP